MRNYLKQGAVVCLMAVAGFVHAATVTLSAGSSQPVLLTDPQTGSQINLSVPLGGYSHFEFSNGTAVLAAVPRNFVGGSLGALNVLGAEVTAIGGGSVTELQSMVGARVKTKTRSSMFFDSGVSSVTIDQASSKLVELQYANGFQVALPCRSGMSDGGAVTFSNLKFNFSRMVVSGDLSSTSSWSTCGTPPTLVRKNVDIWAFTMSSGNLVIPVAAIAANDKEKMLAAQYNGPINAGGRIGSDYSARIVINSLRMLPEAFGFVRSGLGIGVGSVPEMWIGSNLERIDGWGQLFLMNRINVTSP